jgi:hypothetical protein
LHQSENLADDAGERNAGLYQNKPQGILQTGGCEVHLSRDGNETVYNSRQGKKMQCKQQTNQQANQQTNQQTDI